MLRAMGAPSAARWERQVDSRKGYDGAFVLKVPPEIVTRTGPLVRKAIGKCKV